MFFGDIPNLPAHVPAQPSGELYGATIGVDDSEGDDVIDIGASVVVAEADSLEELVVGET